MQPTQTETLHSHEDEAVDPLATLYRFLALGMRYPHAEVMTRDYVEALAGLLADLDEQDEIFQVPLQNDTWLEALRIEYTRLFVNAIPHVIAPPYASVYMDGDGSVQGKTTEKTRIFYRERGFALADEVEPADNLSLELEFLGHLCADSRFEDEELFLKTLFRPWFKRFYNQVINEVRHPLYRVLIQIIDNTTREEQ